MAMNKSEREEMERLRTRLALAWPPEPPRPMDAAFLQSKGRWRGWWVNHHSGRIGEGVVDRHLHSTQALTDSQLDNRHSSGSHVTMTQGLGGPWYSTKLDAMRAIHWMRAAEAAKDLRRIELLIEAEAALGKDA